MRSFIVVAVLALGTLSFVAPQVALAQPSQLVPCSLSVDDPETPEDETVECTVCHFVGLGQRIMNFFVAASVAVGALLFVNAGALYIFSPGNPGNISRGHRIFTNTLVGILFILVSWIIVDFIMRALVKDELIGDEGTWGPWNEILCTGGPVGPAAPAPEAPPPVASGACTPLTPLSDPLAIRMDAGETVIWDSTDPDLRVCATRFAASVGGRITSVYRPAAYQTHLREIFNRWCGQNLRSNTDPTCAAVKEDVQRHVTQHFGRDWACGAVGVTSRHTSGTAVDISGDYDYAATAAEARTLCLNWRNYPGDPYHYDLIAGCSC